MSNQGAPSIGYKYTLYLLGENHTSIVIYVHMPGIVGAGRLSLCCDVCVLEYIDPAILVCVTFVGG